MKHLQEHVMLTADANGKLTRAVLQRQVDEPVLFHDAINYEDVRELPINPDGVVTLGTTPESEEQEMTDSQRVQHSLSELERLWVPPQETLKRIYEGRELAQKILDIVRQASTSAEAKDAEEEFAGRGYGILFDALENIEKLCQEQLQKGST